MVEVNARLQVLNGAVQEDLEVTDDAASATGRALPVVDAGVRTLLGTDGTTPPAVLGSGTGVRGWLRSIYEKLTGSIAVTGTFWQATQPVSGPVTDTQLRATAVPVSGTFFQATQPVSGPLTDAQFTARTPDTAGTWGYNAGASGTVTLTGSKRVIGIAAHATTAGSFTINAGDSIPVPANSSIEIQPLANLVDATIIFTGTDSYFVETLV